MALSLTPREKDVVRSVIAGNRSGAIAKELGLAPKTIAVHKHNIHCKLGTRSDVDLYKWAQEHGKELKV